MNCTNNDLDARDRRGASCESGYTSDTYYCGVFDDEDFSAFEDCCDCGGGTRGGTRNASNNNSCIAPNVPYGRDLNNTACTPLSVVAAGTMCTFIPLDGFICPESPGRCEGGSFENKISRCRFLVSEEDEASWELVILISSGLVVCGIIVGVFVWRYLAPKLEESGVIKVRRSTRRSFYSQRDMIRNIQINTSERDVQERAMEESRSIHEDIDSCVTFEIQWRDLQVREMLKLNTSYRGRLNLPNVKDVSVTLNKIESNRASRKTKNDYAVDETLLRELHLIGRYPRLIFVYGYAILTKQIRRLVDIDADWILVKECTNHGTLDRLLYNTNDHLKKQRRLSRKSSVSSSPMSKHKSTVRKPTWGQRMVWAIDIADALTYLEHHGITHGNLRTTSCYLFLEDSAALDFMSDDAVSPI